MFVKQLNYQHKLAAILLLYLVLAVTYSIVVPIGRGADEWAHYWYAQFIAQNGRLPANPAEREAAGYKADWPPLYHLMAAGLTGWVDTAGPPAFKYRADNTRRQLVPAQGPEAILHTRDEMFPWQQEILVWRLGRFLSIIFSAATLGVTYLITLELFTRRRSPRTGNVPYRLPGIAPQTLALAAVGVLAFNPRFLFTGMLFNYDSLTLLLSTIFLWLAIRVAKGYYPRWGFWLLGAVAGLALVAKYLAAPLVLVIIAIAWRRARAHGSKDAEEQRSRGAGEQRSISATFHSSLITHHSSRPTPRFIKSLVQAGFAFLLITSWWFGYLLINFNEIDAYGPVLGALAPLIRGDGSDRTVEELFAWLSDGQTPAPDYIEKQSYTAWQIIAELPTTFWGNPIVRPYPLNWFIWAISLTTLLAAIGLGLYWWGVQGKRFWLNLLLFYCLLPAPFMLIRLFGARDALEAVQGRHILFLAGPAFAILLVVGCWSVAHIMSNIIRVLPQVAQAAPHLARPILMDLLVLLATGALAQLVFMVDAYPPPLPVQTTPYSAQAGAPVPNIILPGGAVLIDYQIKSIPHSSLLTPHALQVTLVWQGGDTPAPADYQTELALVDAQGQTRSGWLAYQTQARYPTRAWEPGDTIFDKGYLPLVDMPPGEYEIHLRILEEGTPLTPWYTLTTYTLSARQPAANQWTLWQNGQPASNLPQFQERETAQFTISNLQSPISNLQLTNSHGLTHNPTSTAGPVANIIIQPHWPAGEYQLAGIENSPILRVAKNERNFELPAIPHPLEANFDGKIKLLGYHLPSRRVEPGEGLPVTLYWQGLQWMGREFVIFNRLLDNSQVAWGGYDRMARENYSTLLWAPGQVITDGFAVPVAADAPDGVYTLSLGWYQKVGGQAHSLPILNPETGSPTDATSVQVGPIKVGGAPAGVTVNHADPQNPVNVSLGAQIELLGYDWQMNESANLQMDESTNQPNSTNSTNSINSTNSTNSLNLTFYWQALRQPDTDYTVFTHVRNEAGETVAQKDQPPTGGAYPTSLWDAGEIIKDEVTIPVGRLEAGQYELVAGMYNFATGARLPVGESAEGAILLRTFEVGKQE